MPVDAPGIATDRDEAPTPGVALLAPAENAARSSPPIAVDAVERQPSEGSASDPQESGSARASSAKRLAFRPLLPGASSTSERKSEAASRPQAVVEMTLVAPPAYAEDFSVSADVAEGFSGADSPTDRQARPSDPPSKDSMQSRRTHSRAAAPEPMRSPGAVPQNAGIEIHIGRVEVLAVPQPAPRPAAPPTRKGISLDEYLRRKGRNGGAG
jgi:hypothetical protein